jgi:hypothetical protein
VEFYVFSSGTGSGVNDWKGAMENTASSKLDALRKREAALREAIAAEKVRQQKRREKDEAREAAVIGEALVRYAGQSSDFRLMLKQVLQSAELRDGDRAFLAGKGWL